MGEEKLRSKSSLIWVYLVTVRANHPFIDILQCFRLEVSIFLSPRVLQIVCVHYAHDVSEFGIPPPSMVIPEVLKGNFKKPSYIGSLEGISCQKSFLF